MNDAFPMDHDLDLGFRDVEEPPGFDDFETLFMRVAESIVILAPIFQLGCWRCPFGCNVLQLLPAQGPEGSSGRRQDQTADILFAMAF